MTPVTAPADAQLSQCRVFLKGEPKALGIVQIMIGVMTFLFGIILTTSYFTVMTISGISRITLWGSLIVISSGSLSVAAVNHSNSCLVKAPLVMNVFSALVAGITLILLTIDMIFIMDWCYYSDYNGYPSCNSIRHLLYSIHGVLFVFSLLELIISICTSAFACNAHLLHSNSSKVCTADECTAKVCTTDECTADECTANVFTTVVFTADVQP
ncbi:membrane-spanning 4-domains subfamily A member 4A-like isoform X2 [Neoarius graeffei]|nr:membrane-spanning 4-domains subfamily A member 4A-like isoform X2 [Neoarius graeffei]XP_060774069.1 membrane-spanning 4-domains subfamily A member 4A-like isoform X2 [Neoarius graeffei]XP_060774070.1 membrane-spanning 4-domains subfamily A member 4A-like isoform X2 [Neoarius graeffei]